MRTSQSVFIAAVCKNGHKTTISAGGLNQFGELVPAELPLKPGHDSDEWFAVEPRLKAFAGGRCHCYAASTPHGHAASAKDYQL
jgi:hypothetical protein